MADFVHQKSAASDGAKPGGFTLLELLVSGVVFAIVVGLSFGIIHSVSEAWKAQKSRLTTFESARTGFELLTNRLSQATLNTYWDYNNRAAPTRYIRRSELHYIQGDAAQLIPTLPGRSTQSVFFVAPLGFTEATGLQPLVKMLTACGFYVAFSGETDRPDFLGSRIPQRYRFRLHQFLQPGEDLAVYKAASGNQWFEANVAQHSFPMIENVIALFLRAKYPDTNGKDIPTYAYDSRSATPPGTTNQLPPNIEVTLVVIDEASAVRLAATYGEAQPPILPKEGAFEDADQYEKDLGDWEEEILRKHPIKYRIFTANIPIRSAKWSSD